MAKSCRTGFDHARQLIDWRHHPHYNTIHRWINGRYPRTGRCEWCASTHRRTSYATACKGIYSHNRADWLELCGICHHAFDGGNSEVQRAAAAAVGRAKRGTKHSPEAISRMVAANRRRAKLTEDDVRAIRYASAQGVSYSRLAALFDVHIQTIAPVVRRETWKDVA